MSDGHPIYDFLGGATDASYKSGWDKKVAPAGKPVKPGYTSPSEWTVDWIACFLAAKLAGDRFKVTELAAGYGQWMVTSIIASKSLRPENPAHRIALDAEQTHFRWLRILSLIAWSVGPKCARAQCWRRQDSTGL